VLAYAVFSVSSEIARDACLRLASTGSLVVHVNGEETLRRDCQRRPLGFDQDICTFRLRPGKNLVCVKVCAQQGAFATRMRLTTPDGSPLPARVQVSADPAQVTAAGRRKLEGDAARAAAPRLGAISWLTRRLASLEGATKLPNRDSATAHQLGMHAFRLAYLLALRAEDDDATRRDKKWAKVAVELLPDFGAAHYLLAFTLVKRGGSAADRDENARMQAYLDAVRAWPRCAEAMRALAGLERLSRGNLAKAEEWVRRSLAVNPSFVFAKLEQLALLQARGFDSGRTQAAMEFFANPDLGTHPGIMGAALDVLSKRSDIRAMIDVQKKLLATDYRWRSLVNLARLQMRSGDAKTAMATAQLALRDFPQQRLVYETIARLATATGDLAASARTWDEWLEICPEDERAWLSLAELAARADKRDLVIAHLERAVALNPNLKDPKRRLEYLQAGATSFYEGYEIDTDAALTSDKGADADAAEKGDSHYYLFRHVLIRAYRDGTTSRYDHFLVRVLSEEGANLFDTYRPQFYRGDQTARILEAKVIRPDGTKVRAHLGRSWRVDLPPIKKGDCVEVKARVDDRSRSFFGDYFGLQHLFPSNDLVPVRRSRLDLILEPGRTYHFQKTGAVPEPKIAKLDDGAEYRLYEMTGLARSNMEERAPSPIERGPLLRVSTYATWDQFSSWWWNLIRKQTIATPEIKAKVQELIAGASSLEEKVQRIYDFVVTDIRYKAWEFGVHGYKPYSVGSIFARRHGDCKDKAILTNAMLAEIGVEAFPVLIRADNARERDDLTLPMVEHFNHCISYIPAQKGLPARFVDGTAEYHPIDTLPTMDRGASVLTVTAKSGEIMKIPWTLAQVNRDELRFRIQLQSDGDALVEMQHRPHLNFAPSIRKRYGNEPGRRRERLSDSLGKKFGKVEILDMQFSDLADHRAAVAYNVKFKVKNFAAADAGKLRVRTAFQPDQLSRLTPAERRIYDILLQTPTSRDVTVEYEAPEGWAWGSLPDGVEVNSSLGSFRMSVRRDGRKVTIHRLRELKRQRIEASHYADFKQLTESIDRAEATEVELKPKKVGK
jgi:tetratricopeptide (TPR) repeat protein